MAHRRNTPLDSLEARLTGPKRVALFGHRDVGKTTLLAMLYRQASAGLVPGLRLAAGDPATAEYLAEKIAQIESGAPPAGTLAETELTLRLYHGPARFDLVVKDYQGEHVTLGADEPIQQFFADCDAVWLCLDPEGPASEAERRRRQQEVENLLERYIDRSDDGTLGRPVALLLTKFDRVLARDPNAVAAGVVEARYGMTRHALDRHARDGALFAVSAYGRDAGADGRPPADLQPLGLDAPLAWLAERLEEADGALLDRLWALAPRDPRRLARCVAAFERHYPHSDRATHFRKKLKALQNQRARRVALRLVAASALVALALAGYDAWGYRAALAFERDHPAAPLARERWADLIAWHPTLALFWPQAAHVSKRKRDEWTARAAEVQSTTRHAERWAEARAEALADADDPEKPLRALRAFLRDYPDTEHRAAALALARSLKTQTAARQAARDKRLVDDLARAEALPNADFRDLIDRAQQFLTEHPDSDWRGEVARRQEEYARKLDERDIERARQYSRQYPTNFAARIERYHDYLKAHQAGGRFLSEATEAKDRVAREWDAYAYRQAYDHWQSHPDDVAEVARRFRDYLRDHRDGRHARDARHYLDWWDKVSVPGEYRVTLRRGEVDPGVGKYLGGGGPDLGVTVEVAGVTYGPSPVVRNTHKPIWDYTFPRPVRWKSGDPVRIRIYDYDWSDSVVYTLNSRKDDPLALRLLSGTIKPAKGGKTTLVFASDFTEPKLTPPE